MVYLRCRSSEMDSESLNRLLEGLALDWTVDPIEKISKRRTASLGRDCCSHGAKENNTRDHSFHLL